MAEEKKTEKQPEEKKVEEIDRTFPEVTSGSVVKVHQEISEINPKGEEKKRIQVFEGTVLARKHGKGINATVTVRKVSGGIPVEKIYPLHSPNVKKIEIIKKYKRRQAKLGYLRTKHKRLREIKD
jgi:large subunit ribosomal protein L19